MPKFTIYKLRPATHAIIMVGHANTRREMNNMRRKVFVDKTLKEPDIPLVYDVRGNLLKVGWHRESKGA